MTHSLLARLDSGRRVPSRHVHQKPRPRTIARRVLPQFLVHIRFHREEQPCAPYSASPQTASPSVPYIDSSHSLSLPVGDLSNEHRHPCGIQPLTHRGRVHGDQRQRSSTTPTRRYGRYHNNHHELRRSGQREPRDDGGRRRAGPRVRGNTGWFKHIQLRRAKARRSCLTCSRSDRCQLVALSRYRTSSDCMLFSPMGFGTTSSR